MRFEFEFTGLDEAEHIRDVLEGALMAHSQLGPSDRRLAGHWLRRRELLQSMAGKLSAFVHEGSLPA